MSHIDSLHSSQSDQWFTPPKYLKEVVEVLGWIDLDPASCPEAQVHVQAKRYFTRQENGLLRPWHGKIFLNPPYGKTRNRSNQGIWSQKLIDEYNKGNVTEAILLTNAQTPEKWFQPLWQYTVCLTDHRIPFDHPDGRKQQPTHGNAFTYFGPNPEKFIQTFLQFGRLVPPKGSY